MNQALSTLEKKKKINPKRESWNIQKSNELLVIVNSEYICRTPLATAEEKEEKSLCLFDRWKELAREAVN